MKRQWGYAWLGILIFTSSVRADSGDLSVSPPKFTLPRRIDISSLPRLYTLPSPLQERKSNFYLGLGGNFTSLPTYVFTGFEARVGYQGVNLGTDIRYSQMNRQLRSLLVPPDHGVTRATPVEGSPIPVRAYESDRIRHPTDSWQGSTIEVGIQAAARLFTGFLPLLTERSRFGLGYGNYTDVSNGLSFSGILPSVELGFQYQLSSSSPITLDLAISYHWGFLQLANVEPDLGRLPVSFAATSLSFAFWF